MKTKILLLAVALATAVYAAEAPKAEPAATTQAAMFAVEKERDALMSELTIVKKELADLRKSAHETVNFLQNQRNDALGKLADMEINLAFAKKQIDDLKKDAAKP